MGARELLETILVKEPEKRATLDQIIKSNWVTNKSKEVIESQNVELDTSDKNGLRNGFGNLSRLLLLKSETYRKT